jgi:hypothetical protein
MEELKSTRHKWFESYLSGDTQLLQSIELPSFTVISKQGTESTDIRYSKIESKKLSGDWFSPTAKHEEFDLTYLTNKNKCNVSGHGKLIGSNGQVLSEVDFKECWIRQGKQWFIESLHVDSA